MQTASVITFTNKASTQPRAEIKDVIKKHKHMTTWRMANLNIYQGMEAIFFHFQKIMITLHSFHNQAGRAEKRHY